MKIILSFLLILFYSLAFSQSGIVRGLITNALNNNPIEQAKVQVLDQQLGAISDENGVYEIRGIKPGVILLKLLFQGLKLFKSMK
jgi:hypothetical protein